MRKSEYCCVNIVIFMGTGMGLQHIAIYDGSNITAANCVGHQQINYLIYYLGRLNFKLTVAKSTLKFAARFETFTHIDFFGHLFIFLGVLLGLTKCITLDVAFFTNPGTIFVLNLLNRV
jgi:hypothetical protein